MPTETFEYEGEEQYWTVPEGVFEVTVEMEAGDGGSDSDDADNTSFHAVGGYAEGTFPVDPGEELTIFVGEAAGTSRGSGSGGWPDGGDGSQANDPTNTDAYGGGGRSEVRYESGDSMIVAGGGGGNAYNASWGAGDGGGSTGEDGDSGDKHGRGGTQTEGGGRGDPGTGRLGEDGDKFYGGDGHQGNDFPYRGGGGGGGGWYGGGAGVTEHENDGGGGHGGGGSGYVHSDGWDTSLVQGGGSGHHSHGEVVIEYTVSPPDEVQVDRVGHTEVDLSWDERGEADEYRLYRDGSQIATLTTESYTDDDVSQNTQHEWTVTVVADGEESDHSDPGIATTGGPISTPSVTAGNREVDVSWGTANGDVEQYRVDRQSSVDNGWDHNHFVTTQTDRTDDGLIDGREYEYRVRVEYHDGITDPSGSTSDTTDLPAPTTDSVTATNLREVVIGWSRHDNNPEGFVRLWRRDEEDGDIDIVETRHDNLDDTDDFVDSGNHLLDGEEYYWQVFRHTGDTGASGGQIPEVTVLPPVEDLTVDEIDGRHVTLSFTQIDNNEADHEILLREDDEGGYSADGTVDGQSEGSTVTYQTTELLDGQLYGCVVETATDHETVRSDDT